jgi:hypothetical protein
MDWIAFATSLLTVVFFAASLIVTLGSIVLPYAWLDDWNVKPLLITVTTCVILAALSYAFLAGLGVEVA